MIQERHPCLEVDISQPVHQLRLSHSLIQTRREREHTEGVVRLDEGVQMVLGDRNGFLVLAVTGLEMVEVVLAELEG